MERALYRRASDISAGIGRSLDILTGSILEAIHHHLFNDMSKLSEFREGASQRLTQPIGQLLAKSGLTPNTVTILGFLLGVVAALLVGTRHLLWAGFVLLISGFFDLLDGTLARLTQKTTQFGAVLDSTLDRVSEIALLSGILVLYIRQESTTGVLLVFATVAGSVLVSYVKARAEGVGLSCKEGLFTRAERVVVLSLGLFTGQLTIALWILAVLTNVTVVQRLLYLWQQTRR